MNLQRAGYQLFKIPSRDYSPGYVAFSALNYLFMLIAAVAFLYPVLNVISCSISEARAVMAGEVFLFPKGIDLKSYRLVWATDTLRIGILNSIFYATVGCAACVFSIALTSYPLSKRRFIFRKSFTLFMAITMFFGGGLIPTFLVVKNLGLYNTRLWIIMASMFSPWHIIIMRTFFQNIPIDLEESAKLDGASDMKIMMAIYIPLSTPVIATIALFTIVGYWNSYFTALVYLMDSVKMPMQVVLRNLIMKGGDYLMFGDQVSEEFTGIDYQMYIEKLKYTAIVVTMAPMIVLFLSLQKYFIKGVLVGSIKG